MLVQAHEGGVIQLDSFGDALQAKLLALLDTVKGDQMALWSGGPRNGVAVGTGRGMAEQHDQALFDLVGDHMLPAPRLQAGQGRPMTSVNNRSAKS